MRYSLIIAGGSGTRLWPMSRASQPKQLIPFIGGQSLLRIADGNLHGLVPPDNRYICAGLSHKAAILEAIEGVDEAHYLGEPVGRDTVNAVGLGAAVIGRRDPGATIAVFSADHIIRPRDTFQEVVNRGFELAESDEPTLVTFGITPTHAATGYGYLQLAEAIEGGPAHVVDEYREKPDAATAEGYLAAGPQRYLWNSGMFVWRASVLMDRIQRYAPENHAALMRIAEAWDSDRRDAVLAETYPTLKKISVDYAVMEPAAADPGVRVVAVPMPVEWLDVGSWPAFAKTCETDEHGNAVAADNHLLMETSGTLVASSDPDHLVTTIGCEGLIVIHTPKATLVCRADRDQDIKALHKLVGERFGADYL